MNITVIGCGRWGSLITWYLDHIGHRVTLYGRAASPRMQAFLTTRQNDLLTLPESVALSTALDAALESAETVIISIGSQGLRSLLGQPELQALRNRTVVLCMKGLEMGTGARLSLGGPISFSSERNGGKNAAKNQWFLDFLCPI